MTTFPSPRAGALAVSIVLSLLSACTTTSPTPARPRPAKPTAAVAPPATLLIATEDDVRDCKLISRLGSLGPRLGESSADSLTRTRSEVLAKASEVRATHLVWGEAQFSYAPASSVAEAYRCAR